MYPSHNIIIMFDILSSFVDSISRGKLDSINFLNLSIGSSASALILGGFVPRVGPGRAVALALRSLFRSGPQFASRRTEDKIELLSLLNSLKQHQFIVCKGARGIGKSHMIQDALAHTFGVVQVTVSAGTNVDTILQRVHAQIANISLAGAHLNPEYNSLRVLWWYRLIFQRSPIVVIAASERTLGQASNGVPFADIPAAARMLASMGFRVIVDASENSIAGDDTDREQIQQLTALPLEVNIMFKKQSSLIIVINYFFEFAFCTGSRIMKIPNSNPCLRCLVH
jgi:hypothetical protein